MSFIKYLLVSAFCISAIGFPTFGAEQKTPSVVAEPRAEVWAPVDESDWAVYMDAPAYHFNLAKEYLQKGDYSKASFELKRGNSFLIFQKNRISFAEKQIEELAGGLAAGKEKDIHRFDSLTSAALLIINQKFSMLPIEIEPKSVFEDEFKYHAEKAKSDLLENDRAKAASEIRKAASFLRLKAGQMRHVARAELDSAGSALKELASKVESGAVKDAKELEEVFQKAKSAVFKRTQK